MNDAMFNYTPFTAEEVVAALNLNTQEDISVAQEMLDGAIRFTQDELEWLAVSKGISVEDMLDIDDTFSSYRDPVMETQKEIALRMFLKGFDVEFVAEITGLPVEKVLRLRP